MTLVEMASRCLALGKGGPLVISDEDVDAVSQTIAETVSTPWTGSHSRYEIAEKLRDEGHVTMAFGHKIEVRRA